MHIIIPYADELILLDEHGGYTFASLRDLPSLPGECIIYLPEDHPTCRILKKAYPHAVCQWDAHARRERAAYAGLISLHEKALQDGIKRIRASFTHEQALVHAWTYTERLEQQARDAKRLLTSLLKDCYPLASTEHGEEALTSFEQLRDPTAVHAYDSILRQEIAWLHTADMHARRLQKEILTRLTRIAPATSRIATPRLLIRLLQRAGSLASLARMHAGKIQLLGSEKALFTALRKKKPTPKYGLLYQHPLVQRLPNREKARAARSIAELISIASRHDALTPYTPYDEIIRLAEEKLRTRGFPMEWLHTLIRSQEEGEGQSDHDLDHPIRL